VSGPQWDGIVTEVWPDADTFTAELRREGSPDLIADFSMAACGVTVREGDVLLVTGDRVSVRDLGTWTQEEIDAICKRAEAQAERLRELPD
jgi:hypothetical protein